MLPAVEEAAAEVERLRERVQKLEKINAVLLARVESDTASRAGPFALFQSNVELQHKVQERTEELSHSLERIRQMNDELIAATNKADAANQAKTRFLAQAGHDLLQPVTAARLSLSALEDSIDEGGEGDNKRLIHQIGRSLATMETSLRAVLDISRLDTGVIKPEIQPVSLGALLGDLEEDFSRGALQRSLRLDVLPSSLVVASDPAMLARILQNLIGNALKYTRKGRVLVGVRRRHASARIDVIDTGPGIAQEHFSLIFEEFQRVKGATRDGEGGLGLGLAIVRRLVDALGHTLTMASEPGSGTRFSLELPLTAFATPERRSRAIPGRSMGQWIGQGRTVFVVDNDHSVRQAITDLLARWGCRPVQYSGSRDAPSAAKSCPEGPNLMIVDYHLDGETALEVVRAFALAFGRPIPVLVITADRSDAVAISVRRAGIELTYKPVRPLDLRSKIDEILLPGSER